MLTASSDSGLLTIGRSIRRVNVELYNNLNEIELRNGNDIIISFTNTEIQAILGRGNEIRKLVYFDRVWKSLKRTENINSYGYVDLRFNKYVYLGLSDSSIENEET